MARRIAKADVTPVRQRTQFTCMSTSLMMCLQALGYEVDEDEVNEVMGARPKKGAQWENALAAAQHYGCRATLVVPSTVRQLKAWTDRGIPVMIAWNPEGREWSHASVVFDVTPCEEHGFDVHVADPNMPDPDETVRVVPKAEFYSKWAEKWPDYLVRRPAMAVEREVTADGRQVMASKKAVDLKTRRGSTKTAEPYDCYKDGLRGRALADCYKGFPNDLGPSEISLIQKFYPGWGPSHGRPRRAPADPKKLAVLDALLAKRPGDRFIRSIRDQVAGGRRLSDKQLKIVRQSLYRNRMRSEADLFRTASGSPLMTMPDYGLSMQERWERGYVEDEGRAAGITPADVHQVADDKGVEWDDSKPFMDMSERVTGKRHLDDMSPKQLEDVVAEIEKKAAPADSGAGSDEDKFYQDPEKREVREFAESKAISNSVEVVESHAAELDIPEAKAVAEAEEAPLLPTEIVEEPGGKEFSTLNRYVINTEQKGGEEAAKMNEERTQSEKVAALSMQAWLEELDASEVRVAGMVARAEKEMLNNMWWLAGQLNRYLQANFGRGGTTIKRIVKARSEKGARPPKSAFSKCASPGCAFVIQPWVYREKGSPDARHDPGHPDADADGFVDWPQYGFTIGIANDFENSINNNWGSVRQSAGSRSGAAGAWGHKSWVLGDVYARAYSNYEKGFGNDWRGAAKWILKDAKDHFTPWSVWDGTLEKVGRSQSLLTEFDPGEGEGFASFSPENPRKRQIQALWKKLEKMQQKLVRYGRSEGGTVKTTRNWSSTSPRWPSEWWPPGEPKRRKIKYTLTEVGFDGDHPTPDMGEITKAIGLPGFHESWDRVHDWDFYLMEEDAFIGAFGDTGMHKYPVMWFRGPKNKHAWIYVHYNGKFTKS